ncbi:hypothetical protein [Actinoallomurus soli]|uniref:hypothetical protein n=1 Tax=Actinoallomurus soli TaxID=2952535 RepID=UPI002092721C|nr:hypothetical protein [Actinoallomurus soli]MCO5968235.1 hypothetical protein [Actinoallomurus soli]
MSDLEEPEGRCHAETVEVIAADFAELHRHGLSDTDIFQVVLTAAVRCSSALAR